MWYSYWKTGECLWNWVFEKDLSRCGKATIKKSFHFPESFAKYNWELDFFMDFQQFVFSQPCGI